MVEGSGAGDSRSFLMDTGGRDGDKDQNGYCYKHVSYCYSKSACGKKGWTVNPGAF